MYSLGIVSGIEKLILISNFLHDFSIIVIERKTLNAFLYTNTENKLILQQTNLTLTSSAIVPSFWQEELGKW